MIVWRLTSDRQHGKRSAHTLVLKGNFESLLCLLREGTGAREGFQMTAFDDWNLWLKSMSRAQKKEVTIRSMIAGKKYDSVGDTISELHMDVEQLRRDFSCYKQSLLPDM